MEGVDHEGRTVELLEKIEEYHSEDLLHLLDCEACQGVARDRVGSSAGAPRMARPDHGVLLEELEARTPGLLKEMAERAAELLRSYRRNPLLVFEGLPSPSSMG